MRIAPELPRYHYRPADKSGGGKQPDLSIQLTSGTSQRIPNVPTLALIQMGTPARLVEPVWKWIADGCHLTRDTEAAIVAAGFSLERCEREVLYKGLPICRPGIRGIARKAA